MSFARHDIQLRQEGYGATSQTFLVGDWPDDLVVTQALLDQGERRYITREGKDLVRFTLQNGHGLYRIGGNADGYAGAYCLHLRKISCSREFPT